MNATSALAITKKLGTGREVEIHYNQVEKMENLNLIHGIIEKCSFILPSWLRSLTVTVYDNPPDDAQWSEANCSPENWEYGTACIRVFAKFFDRTEQSQHEIIIHELIHVAHGKVLALATGRMLACVEKNNKDLYDDMLTSHHQVVEEFTEHMTDIIMDRINANRK